MNRPLNHHHQPAADPAADSGAGDGDPVVVDDPTGSTPAAVVDAIVWPAGFRLDPTARAALIRDVAGLLTTHPVQQIVAAMSALEGARSPIAVARMRLRELAAAPPAPAAPTAPQAGRVMAAHRYAAGGVNGACTHTDADGAVCGRHEFAPVHPRSAPATRCEHNRPAVMCVECGGSPIPHQSTANRSVPA